MSFVVYDLAFMVLFTIAAVLFLYSHRRKLKRQGWMYLYHSTRGISFMKSFARKYEKILRPTQYVVVACGYILMISILWMMVSVAYRYLTVPQIVEVVKAPPIAPLIPYFPTLFGVDAFFPPLYFTYFIVALAVVAIVHEFSHGIFAKLNGIRIKTTGFAFLGPILGAFVEQDDKQMNRAKKFPQLTILAAGTFANVVFAALFGIVAGLFFMASFAPAGVNFNAYPTAQINSSLIDSVDQMEVASMDELIASLEGKEGLLEVEVGGQTFIAQAAHLKAALDKGIENVIVFEDSPAVNAGLRGPITAINGEAVTSREDLSAVLAQYSPGDTITITTKQNEEVQENEITLGEREGKAYLGIIMNYPQGSLNALYFNFIASSKNTGQTYYETTWGGDFAWFIYHLLWWLVLINFFVALFNMLPLGILDGGRFFYLTIWGITGSEKAGANSYKFATWFIIGLFVLMMIGWLIGIL